MADKPPDDKFPDEEPLARNSDPESSHEAADRLNKSGARRSQKLRVLDALVAWQQRWPDKRGPTSNELAVFAAMDRTMVGRRLPDLKRDRYVEQREQVDPDTTGAPGVTWKTIPKQESLL